MGINAELFPIWITVLFYIVWVATIIYAIISVDWTTVFLIQDYSICFLARF